MIKHFCNMCGKELPKDDCYSVYARCNRLHIGYVGLDFCWDCVVRAFGMEAIDKALTKYEERQKRMGEQKVR